MESEVEEEKFVVPRKRRSSMFFAPEEEVNVDVKFTTEVHYPPDYENKLQQEYRQWKQTCLDFKNTVRNLRQELQDSIKHPIDMTILDKEQQQFFRNIPAIYFSYIKTFEDFVDEVHTASTMSENVTKYTKQLANDLEERLESTDKKLIGYLQTVDNRKYN